jgi:hypothetical protein
MYGGAAGDLELSGTGTGSFALSGAANGTIELLGTATAFILGTQVPGVATISDALAYLITLSDEDATTLGVWDAAAYLSMLTEGLSVLTSLSDEQIQVEIEQTFETLATLIEASDSSSAITQSLRYVVTVSDQLVVGAQLSQALASSDAVEDSPVSSILAVQLP